jgi:hypothetical protein
MSEERKNRIKMILVGWSALFVAMIIACGSFLYSFGFCEKCCKRKVALLKKPLETKSMVPVQVVNKQDEEEEVGTPRFG